MRNFEVIFTKSIEKEVGIDDNEFRYEGGWWTKDKVYVCSKSNKDEQFLVLLHEIIEKVLEEEYNVKHGKAHKIATKVENYVERLLRRENIWE